MSPSQASETCASASSATSANGNSLYESRFDGVKKAGSIHLQRAHPKRFLVSPSIIPISPIHVRVSAICEMTSPPIIVCAVTVPIANAVPTIHVHCISSIGRVSSSPAIPTTVTCVVAVHKLPALFVPIRSATTTTALCQRCRRQH